MEEDRMRKDVRKGYARIARQGLGAVRGSSAQSCCGGQEEYDRVSEKMGYSKAELQSVPEGANLSLGCGNPVALASLKEGETVVDLGSGAGFDCFLAAKRVGKKGKVIGVDMTPEMLDKARENARKGKYGNVEFRLGEIENLPVADNTANVVISNCVVNLAPDKRRVFEEALRVLKPGGRMMLSDVVLLNRIPESVRERAHAASCVKSAMLKDKYIQTIEEAGFENVRIVEEKRSSYEDVANDPDAQIIVADQKRGTQEPRKVSELDADEKEKLKKILNSIASIEVCATKPLTR